MTDRETFLNDVKKAVRSVVISEKGGLSLYSLEKFHGELMGTSIGYKKLGYTSCAAFLADIPDTVRKGYDSTGMEVYKAVADSSTAHIQEMVSRQKSKKPKRGKGAKFSSNSRRPRSTYSFQSTNKYVPLQSYTSYSKPQYPRPSFNRPSAVYNKPHPVHSSGNWPIGQNIGGSNLGQSTLHTTIKNQPTISKPSSLFPRASTNTDNPVQNVSEQEVRLKVKEIVDSYTTGVWLHLLPQMYQGHFGQSFPKQYEASVFNWTDIVDPQKLHGRDILYVATDDSRAAAIDAAIDGAIAGARAVAAKATASAETTTDTFAGHILSADKFYIGEKCNVYVAHVTADMSKIFVQRECSPINTLMSELENHYSNAALKTYTSLPGNCVCATKDSAYMSWNRCVVTKTDYHTRATVMYVDFGNTERKPITHLRPLPQIFTKLPAQAIAVNLFNIATRDNQLLAKEFNAMTENNVPLSLICMSVQDGLCSVVVYESQTAGKSINEKLVQLGLAYWECKDIPKPPAHCPYLATGPFLPTISPRNVPSPVRAVRPIKPALASASPVPAAVPTPLPAAVPTLLPTDVASADSAQLEPRQGSLPDSGYWAVIVTHVLSPSKLFLRIKDDSSESFAEFQEETHKLYVNDKPVSLPEIGEIYMTHVVEEDGQGWYRVRASDLLDSDTMECEFLDYGYISSVDRRNFYTISNKHKIIPYQARLCALYGMDQVKDDSEGHIISKLEEMTDEKTLIAQLVTVEQGIPHIVLFDTAGDEDIEINKELGNLLDDTGFQALLPAVSSTIDVSLTYVERDGTFYVQPMGPANLCLVNLMNDINDYYSKQKTTAQDFVTRPQTGDLVCAKYEGRWYRATVQEVQADRKVVVFYGDYGNSTTLPTSHLRRLPSGIKHINTLPMQGIACKLSGLDDWNDDVGIEAAALIGSIESFVLMTVKAATDGQLAEVQLTHNDLHVNNYLVNVYEASRAAASSETAADIQTQPPILSEPTQTRLQTVNGQRSPGTPAGSPSSAGSQIDSTHPATQPTATHSAAAAHSLSEMGAGDYVSTKLRQLRLDQQSSQDTYGIRFELPPDVGEFWDVFVTTTNEPDHFVVVSLAQIKHLNELIDRLQKEYKDSAPVDFIPIPNSLCAGYSEDDGFWYRVLVQEGKIGDRYKVLFADYGNYEFVKIDRLRPLRPEYMEMKLQAVRAGLYDMIPAVGNCWTPEAREDFIAMCNEKRLVATIKSVDKTKGLLDIEPSVFFELHDTTGDCQINIDAELVNRGHAKYKSDN